MFDQPNTVYPEERQDLFTEPNFIYASFWQRFFAAFIDGIILIIPNYIFQFMFGREELSTYIANIITGWLYGALMESGSWQATVGKRSMRIKVVDMGGQRISFAQASGRHFGKYISTIILLIGYFMMLWDEKKQTLHDRMAGTLIVEGEA
jgi:uncharacterized RDD family membrane protein YckC